MPAAAGSEQALRRIAPVARRQAGWPVRARGAAERWSASGVVFAEPRAGRFAGGRAAGVAAAAVLRAAGARLPVAPAAARRRSFARCGRVLGSRLMMSGALVLGGSAAA